MNSPGRKVIFFDIDGTLITGGKGPFDDDRAAMDEAASKSHFLFLNTGRSFANIPPALIELPSLKGIASGGGAHILLSGPGPGGCSGGSCFQIGNACFHTIYHKWVSDQMITEIFSFFEKQTRCCYLEGERGVYIINGSSRKFSQIKPVLTDSLDEYREKSAGDLITKVTFDGVATGDERRLFSSFFSVNDFPAYSEAIIKGENKATAIEYVLNELGIRREDSIAIGDGVNDLDMIRYAGLGIAMGNASEELKAAAGAVTSDCGKGGVAEALGRFL